MKEIRLANKIIITLTKDRIHYPGRFLADTLTLISRCGVLLAIYYYVFKLNNGVINNVPFNIVSWSLFFYFSFMIFRLRDISRAIMADVRSGNVEVLFNKPISYLLYRAWWQIGSGLYSFFVATFFGSLVLYFMVGLPVTMKIPIFWPSFILTIIFAAILSLLIYSTIGLLAFWLEDVDPIYWIVDKAVMILGGSYLPVALFPLFLYKIAIYSPFGASQFMTHAAYTTWQSDWLKLIGLQIFWIVLFAIIVNLLFKKARNKVSVNGG